MREERARAAAEGESDGGNRGGMETNNEEAETADVALSVNVMTLMTYSLSLLLH